MNRPLSVLRSRTDKGIELSRGVVAAPSYGKSKRSAGVDQAKTVIITMAIEAAPVRNANSHRSAIMPQGSYWRVSPRCGWCWRRWAFGAPGDGVDSTIIGCGASSWWSSRHHWPHGGELGCENESAPQRPTPTGPTHGDVDPGQTQHHRLGRFRLARFGVGLSQQRSAQGELASAPSIGEHAVVAQPGEAAREHVQEEASDELAGVEAHHLALVGVGVVAPAESHLLAVEVDEAVVGDGALVGVAPEVSDDVGGAGERRFSILPIISDSRCATRTIRYSDKRPLCFARRPTTESAIFE